MTRDARNRLIDDCDEADHKAALAQMDERSVDFRPFRQSCFTILRQLSDLRDDSDEGEAKDRLTTLINTLEGVIAAFNCPQGMIGFF